MNSEDRFINDVVKQNSRIFDLTLSVPFGVFVIIVWGMVIVRYWDDIMVILQGI